ncbi:MAG: hypothetical protein KAW09_08750 [Thermoplasmata archaeon]|nr:hypothetical protein [Thermoplasmata archaeon]
MKADSVIILLAAAALFLLGLVGFIITDTQTEMELIPGGDQDNPDDYIQVVSEIRPFFKVGISSIVFGLVVLVIFVLAAGVRRVRGA